MKSSPSCGQGTEHQQEDNRETIEGLESKENQKWLGNKAQKTQSAKGKTSKA